MKLIENFRHITKSKKIIIDCLYAFLSIFFCYWIYQEIKDIQFYSDENYNPQNFIELKAGEELSVTPEIKTDRLWQIHFPISSTQELDNKDFICDSKLLHVERIRNGEEGLYYAVIRFPEPTTEKKFNIKFQKDVKIYCNDSNKVLTKQYGLPSKLCNILIWGFIAVMIFVYLVTNILCAKIKSLAVKYLIFNILLGTAFIIVNPAFNIHDERFHFNTTYNIANILMGKGSYEDNKGLLIRECDNRVYPAEIADNEKFTRDLTEFWKPKDYKKYYPYMASNILKSANNTDDTIIFYDHGGYKRCLYYLPHIAGIIISRQLGFNQHQLYYFTCILALIFNTMILFFAFAKTQCKNILFYFFSLGIYVIQQMGHFTYDGTIYALSIGFIVLFLSYYEQRKISDLFMSLVYFALLWNAKGHLYMPLGLLYLALFDFNKIRNLISRKNYIILSITSFVLLLGLYTFYTLTNPENFVACKGIHQEAQLHGTNAGFIRNPAKTLLTVLLSINYDFFSLAKSFFNFSLGVDSFCSCILLIILNFVIIYAVLKDKTTSLYKNIKIIMIIIFLLVLFGTYYGMYTTWEVSTSLIKGVQGRYLIPVGLLLYMIFNSEKIRTVEAKDNSKLLFYSTIYISFFTIINYFLNIMQ